MGSLWMMFLDDLEYCLERILCLYMDLYIRVAYLIDWIHNRKCQETWGNEVFDILPSDFLKK